MAKAKRSTARKPRRELTEEDSNKRTIRVFKSQAKQERQIRALAKRVLREREKTTAFLGELAKQIVATFPPQREPESEQV